MIRDDIIRSYTSNPIHLGYWIVNTRMKQGFDIFNKVILNTADHSLQFKKKTLFCYVIEYNALIYKYLIISYVFYVSIPSYKYFERFELYQPNGRKQINRLLKTIYKQHSIILLSCRRKPEIEGRQCKTCYYHFFFAFP